MKPVFKAPGYERLKLKWDVMLSSFAFKFKSRRYTKAAVNACLAAAGVTVAVGGGFSNGVGRCRLPVSRPE